MKIGKRTILISPNVTKFGCMVAFLTAWYLWPTEYDYQKYAYETKKAELDKGEAS